MLAFLELAVIRVIGLTTMSIGARAAIFCHRGSETIKSRGAGSRMLNFGLVMGWKLCHVGED